MLIYFENLEMGWFDRAWADRHLIQNQSTFLKQLTECQMNVAWSTGSGGCRGCRRERTKHLRDRTPGGDLRDPRRHWRPANLVSSWDLSLASPYLHNRAYANPRSGPTCPANPTRTLHRPSCRATARDFHDQRELDTASKWRSRWCKSCSHLLRRWSTGLTCLKCLRGSTSRELCRRASSARPVGRKRFMNEITHGPLTSRPSSCFWSSLYRISLTVLSLEPVAIKSPCGDHAMQ